MKDDDKSGFLLNFILQSDNLSGPCSMLAETNKNNTLDNNESRAETRRSTKKNNGR
jgi:hypothetical protein